MTDSRGKVCDLLMESKPIRIRVVVLINIDHSQPAATTDIILTNLESLIPQSRSVNLYRFIHPQIPLQDRFPCHSKQLIRGTTEPYIRQLVICKKTP
jgi:hypothetical protein